MKTPTLEIPPGPTPWQFADEISIAARSRRSWSRSCYSAMALANETWTDSEKYGDAHESCISRREGEE